VSRVHSAWVTGPIGSSRQRTTTSSSALTSNSRTSIAKQVDDDATYQRYREAMTPLLHGHGGSFGYDFVVSRVLQSETARPINRVFTIRFADRGHAEAMFSDPRYLAVRAQLFAPPVSAVTQLAAFDEPVPVDRG
jgi:uncharacterized protein (DUF1330 family)